MTLAQKIRYLRRRMNITQDALAQMAEVHPVSIRKYETNKMVPQPAQLRRISAALGVSYNALSDMKDAGLGTHTKGDLTGVFFVMFNTGILEMTGERGEDYAYKPETVRITANRNLAAFIDIVYPATTTGQHISLDNVLFNVFDEQVFNNLLQWERMCFLCEKYKRQAEEQPTEENKKNYANMLDAKEYVELDLQRSGSRW